MKVKLIAAAVLGLLAFAGIAQATGAFRHKDPQLDEVQNQARKLANALQHDAAGASSSRARRGPRGKRGLRGPKGAQGAPGPAGTFGSVVSAQSSPTFLCSFEGGICAVGSARAECPPGTTVTGGGYSGAGIFTTVTYSSQAENGWGVVAVNFDEVPVGDLRAEALCAG